MFKKILLIFLGFMLALILLELSLQTTSYSLKIYKKYKTNQELKKKDSITILCIGESTTDGQWPQFLENSLKLRGITKKIRVIDEGHGTTDTDYLLKEVIYKKYDEYKPDIIVAMQGINDEVEQIETIRISRLKILSLFYILKESLNSKLRSKHYINKNYANREEKFLKYWEEARKYNFIREYDNAIQIFNYLNTEYPERKIEFISDEIKAYKLSNRIQEAEIIVLNMLEKNPYFDISESLGVACMAGNKNILKKMFPVNDLKLFQQVIKDNLSLFQKIKESFEYLKLKTELLELNSYIRTLDVDELNLGVPAIRKTEDWPLVTKSNYRLLAKFCESKNIKLIAMQYPLRDIITLKTMLEGFEGVIFVSNEKNFKKALKTIEDYKIFSDLFAGDFGHCTDLGNKMIADNLAETIKKLIN